MHQSRDKPLHHQKLLNLLIHRVSLHSDSLSVEIKRLSLDTLVSGIGPDGAAHPAAGAEGSGDTIALTAPLQVKRRGVEAKLVLVATLDRPVEPDQKLVALVTKAFHYMDGLAQGKAVTVRELARQNKINEGDVSQTLPLAFLAPDIVESIMSGQQPLALRAHWLKRVGALPFSWEEQRRLLGFRGGLCGDQNDLRRRMVWSPKRPPGALGFWRLSDPCPGNAPRTASQHITMPAPGRRRSQKTAVLAI